MGMVCHSRRRAGLIGVRGGGEDAKIEVEGAHTEEGEVAHVGGEVAQCSCLQISWPWHTLQTLSVLT